MVSAARHFTAPIPGGLHVPSPGGRAFATPVCHGGLLYVVSEGSKMFILNAASGEKVKEVKLYSPDAEGAPVTLMILTS